jgi:two-component system NtrC family sensor kinase
MLAMIDTHTHHAIPRLIRERRWWLLLLLIWGIAVGFSLHLQSTQIRQHTTEVAIEGARNMFRMVILTRGWNASHGGIYVPITPRTQPNPYLEVPRRDVTTTDGIAMTLINPAYMTRLIGEMAESSSGAIFRLTSLQPIRPANAPDGWERQALQAFERGTKEMTGIEPSPNGDLFRFMAPLTVQESCMPCHRKQGYQVGDIRGGLSVSQKHAPIEAAVQAGVGKSRLTHGLAFLIVALAGWVLLELLRRRWFELASKVVELKETQNQLVQSEKLASIGQLAAGVAHEINNPIGFVSSNFGTLENYLRDLFAITDAYAAAEAGTANAPCPQFDRVRELKREMDYDYLRGDIFQLMTESKDGLERVARIVRDLKDFSRVGEAAWQAVDLHAGIDSTLNIVANELKYKCAVIKNYGQLPPVWCVPSQINQVFMNLLVNAGHAIPDKGEITITTGCQGDAVFIAIADTGTGIAPENLGRIFDPFFTTKPVGSGTGLGLSLAYGIIKSHHGRIEVQSDLGKGTTFTVWLPIKPPEDNNRAVPPAPTLEKP